MQASLPQSTNQYNAKTILILEISELVQTRPRSPVKIIPHLEKGNIIGGGGNSYKNYALDFISKVNITAGY
jgi:hypothetical protein